MHDTMKCRIIRKNVGGVGSCRKHGDCMPAAAEGQCPCTGTNTVNSAEPPAAIFWKREPMRWYWIAEADLQLADGLWIIGWQKILMWQASRTGSARSSLMWRMRKFGIWPLKMWSLEKRTPITPIIWESSANRCIYILRLYTIRIIRRIWPAGTRYEGRGKELSELSDYERSGL